MKSSFGNPFDKKTPASSKFNHVSSSIDTGATARKQQVVSTGVAAKRRDEIFKRVRPATLVRMLEERNVTESIFSMGGTSGCGPGDGRSASSIVASKAGPLALAGAASVASVHSVAGSVLSVVDSNACVDNSRDMVLLDLREPAEFNQCHLPLASNYPASLINRDQFSQELYSCKRDPSKQLIVYHTDEQSTVGVATLLVQKGWDRVHALSGGFDEMVQSYPEVLEGEPPVRPDTSSTTRSTGTARSAARSSSNSRVSRTSRSRP